MTGLYQKDSYCLHDFGLWHKWDTDREQETGYFSSYSLHQCWILKRIIVSISNANPCFY